MRTHNGEGTAPGFPGSGPFENLRQIHSALAVLAHRIVALCAVGSCVTSLGAGHNDPTC